MRFRFLILRMSLSRNRFPLSGHALANTPVAAQALYQIAGCFQSAGKRV
ncbi:exported hypothetical protein [Mesorhizobium plurifarium]|uniref:Uncharacterized protein n=1 Tax=Mesorhizobium plurifarium TaxID=69974 RepID=A0A090E0K7_MESPL|nr:exported hypothetical protein [Mesorhizobium plurifarium]